MTKPKHELTAIVQTIFPLMCIAYWTIAGIDWSTFFIMTIAGWLYFNFVWDISYHRIISHQVIKVKNRFMKMLIAVLGTFSVSSGPVSWNVNHMMHHLFSDGEKDPHSPRDKGWKALSFFFNQRISPEDLTGMEQKRALIMTKHIIGDKDLLLIEKYWEVILLTPGILFLIFGGIDSFIYYYAWPLAVSVNMLLPSILNHTGLLGGKKIDGQFGNGDARNNYILSWMNLWKNTRDHGTHHMKNPPDDFLDRTLKRIFS